MASPSDSPLKRFIREIHRRSLWQVLGIYLVASGAVLGGVGTLGDVLRLPDWFSPLAFALLIVGLPIVLATAFVQEGGPRREARDVEVAAPPSGAEGLFTWRNAIGGGVLAFALLGFVGTGWVLFGGGLSTSEPSESIEQSVAVLPFVNMSGDPDNEYFSDGITEELLHGLARLPGLRVPARTSSFAFKDRNISIRAIADTLGVAHILEGSVRRSGNRVLITAQLVDAESDRHLWSETYERELDDIFAIQREIAQAIVYELQVQLGGEAPVLADRTPTRSPVAHDLYLRGRFEMNQRGEHMPQAIRYFEEAIAEDPDYAKAYGGLALAGSLAGAYGFGEPGLVERSLAAADRAIALDPTLSEPHTARGNSPTRIGGVRAAEQELRLAIQLDPNDANAHQFLGRALMALGMQEEALASATRAILLDPSNVAHHWTRGMFHSLMGDFVEAESDYREALRLEPGNRFALQLLQLELAASGQFDSLRAVTPPDDGIGEMLLRLADPEQRDEGLASLRSNPAAFGVYSPIIAVVFDEWALALDLVERGYARATEANTGFVRYMSLRSELFAPLRNEPRFQAILRNLGIDLE